MNTRREPDCTKMLEWQSNSPEIIRSSAGPDAEIWNFVSPWTKKFRSAQRSNAAEKFVYLWVIVNAWASMVVRLKGRNHQDTYLIKSMAADQILKHRFATLYDDSAGFKSQVDELVSLAPVFQVLWLRNTRTDRWKYDEGETRREFIDRARHNNPYHVEGENCRPAFAPACALEHLDSNQSIPSDWPHILSVTYQIRCNLFHGGKNYESSRDIRFIELAYSILWKMWEPELPDWMRNSTGKNANLPTRRL